MLRASSRWKIDTKIGGLSQALAPNKTIEHHHWAMTANFNKDLYGGLFGADIFNRGPSKTNMEDFRMCAQYVSGDHQTPRSSRARKGARASVSYFGMRRKLVIKFSAKLMEFRPSVQEGYSPAAGSSGVELESSLRGVTKHSLMVERQGRSCSSDIE